MLRKPGEMCVELYEVHPKPDNANIVQQECRFFKNVAQAAISIPIKNTKCQFYNKIL